MGRKRCFDLFFHISEAFSDFESDVRHGILCFMPDPTDTPVKYFFHRLDLSRMYHSICLTCYQVVAKDARESKLFDGEEQHRCKGLPTPVENWKRPQL
jgi:hypothetical protein